MPLTVPNLNLRALSPGPLTSDQIDSNFKTLSGFCNALAAIIGVSLNSDGTLTAQSIPSAAFRDNSIPATALQLGSLPFFSDTGTPNVYAISPPQTPTQYADGMGFFVLAASANTGSSSLNVSGLGAIPIYLYGTTTLPANTIQANGVFCVFYKSGAFYLLGSSGASSSTGTSSVIQNSTQLSQFSPAPIALPGAALNAVFTHNFGVVPMVVNVDLVCKTAELGFSAGDHVPSDNFFDNNGKPVFNLDVNETSLTITQSYSPPYVAQRSATAGTASPITPASWQLSVNATAAGSQNSAVVAPSLSFSMANPTGALCYGTNLFAFSLSDNGGMWPLMQQIDLTTTQLTKAITPDSVDVRKCNIAPLRLGDGADRAILTSYHGTYTFLLNSPTALTALWTDGSPYQKPVYADYSAGSISAVYAMDSQINAGVGINALRAYILNSAGRASYGTVALNLYHASIVNGAAFRALHNGSTANVVLFTQWNPVKRRLYVMDSSSFLLHIFQMTDTTLDWKGWWALSSATTKHADLTYVKSILLAGPVGYPSDTSDTCGAIEFDLTTGAEKSVCLTYGNPYGETVQNPGMIVRIPWREGTP